MIVLTAEELDQMNRDASRGQAAAERMKEKKENQDAKRVEKKDRLAKVEERSEIQAEQLAQMLRAQEQMMESQANLTRQLAQTQASLSQALGLPDGRGKRAAERFRMDDSD